MAAQQLAGARLVWQDDANGVRWIRFEGSLGGDRLERVGDLLARALLPAPRAVVLDLDLVTAIDTAGVAVLVELLRMVHRPHLPIRAARWSRPVDGILRVHRFPEVLLAYQRHVQETAEGAPCPYASAAEDHPQFVLRGRGR